MHACLDDLQHTVNFWQLLSVYSVLNGWVYVHIHIDTYIKDIVQIIKDRSYTTSPIARVCHLYPVAVVMLPAV